MNILRKLHTKSSSDARLYILSWARRLQTLSFFLPLFGKASMLVLTVAEVSMGSRFVSSTILVSDKQQTRT